jgi:Integrase zinc binding domain
VVQLFFPSCKREELLKLAHIQCGFHQGQKRTLECIRISGLYFPSIKDAVNSFCNQCRPCAQARGVTKLDRVPITPIPRAEVPGEHIFMDVTGPIEPSSGNFKFLLATVDSCTSWPTVYLLRNLTAVCECLCELLSFLCVAAVVSSDQGSNFRS